MKKYNTLKEYMYAVADYISMEYGDLSADGGLSDDEKYVVKTMSHTHYEAGDNASNAANLIMNYIKTNRQWMEELNG